MKWKLDGDNVFRNNICPWRPLLLRILAHGYNLHKLFFSKGLGGDSIAKDMFKV